MKNKGYALSAIVYPLLLVCLVLILSILFNLNSKKNLLDNLKNTIKEEYNEVQLCEYSVGKTWIFDYTGGEQEFIIPCSGNYKIELWGAQGGSMSGYTGGKGAYTAGSVHLNQNSNIYIYIGGAGSDTDYSGSYNGGGIILDGQIIFGKNGGGSTDIRLIDGQWNDFNSLKSRIMVAAGGGGANNRNFEIDDYWYGAGNGGAGGSLIGINGESPASTHTNPETGLTYGWNYGTGGTQTKGGSQITNDTQYSEILTDSWKSVGQFGYAQQYQNQTGGGSGYYGGGSTGHGGAGGGSSFISGYDGCDAISIDSTENNIIHTGQSIHYSGYKFTETKMIAGNSSMPTHDGSSTMIGNSGNGYAKITLVSTSS